VWDVSTGEQVCCLEDGHSDWVKGVAWSPFAPAAVASVSDDGTLLLWDADKGLVSSNRMGLDGRGARGW
jgi:WD40 repeat protein